MNKNLLEQITEKRQMLQAVKGLKTPLGQPPKNTA